MFSASLLIGNQATYQYDVAAPTNITISLPGTSEADAERRRKKGNSSFIKVVFHFLKKIAKKIIALAVLSQKLKSVETQDEAWSDDEPTKTEESTAVTIEEPEKSTPAQPTPEE